MMQCGYMYAGFAGGLSQEETLLIAADKAAVQFV
jgi:hypothetical protein